MAHHRATPRTLEHSATTVIMATDIDGVGFSRLMDSHP